MLDKFTEWLASRSQPRFGFYRSARLAYEAYLAGLRVPFERLTAEHHRQAAADPSLREAERGYLQAIELSEREDALQDAAMARYQLGMLLHLQGRLDEAQGAFESAHGSLGGLAHLDRAARAAVSGCHYHLGLLAMRRGRMDVARRQLERSLEIDTTLGDVPAMAVSRAALDRWRELAGGAGAEAGDDEPAAAEEGFAPAGERLAEAITREVAGHADAGRRFSRMLPEIGLAGDRDVLWLLSHSVEANDRVLAELRPLAAEAPATLAITRAAFGSPDPDQAELSTGNVGGRLCGAVLVLEEQGLHHEAFRYWAEWCIHEVAARDDFRLFVFLHDLTHDQVRQRAAAHDELLALLLDTVQIPGSPGVEELRRSVGQYLGRLADVRAAVVWRMVRQRAAILAGRLAATVETVSGLAVSAGFLAALVFGRGAVRDVIVTLGPPLVAVVSGILYFPTLTVPAFFLSRGWASAGNFVKEHPRFGPWVLLAVALGPASVGMPLSAGASSAWLALGMVVGLVLDAARRAGRQMRRAELSLANAMATADARGLSPGFARLARGTPLNPLTCRLVPASAPRVFVSYTRSSDWSRDVASSLHARLRHAGCESFLDRESIGQGSSWRRQLNDSIADANVFITVLDEQSLRQKWVAAELITALAGQRLTGAPEVILLVHPRVARTPDPAALPIFAAVLAHADPAAGEGHPRLIPATDAALRVLLSSLRPQAYRTASVVPPMLTLLFMLLTVPPAAVGGVGPLLGFFAAFLGVLQAWGKVDLGGWLASHALLDTALVLCGYWLGFVARLTAAAFFEVRHEDPRRLGKAHAFSALGFAILLVQWGPGVPALIVGWVLAAAAIGWMLATVFVARSVPRRGG